MEDAYILDGLERADVLEAVRWVKDKHRAETLLHMANVHVYWQDEGPPWSLQNLEDRMVAAGAFIESPQDDDALRAIFATGGASAQTKIEVAPGNLELSDEQGIVVLMDDHQNKHQRDKIAQFKPYTGEPGTKFAVGKDLDWHRDNTVPVVRETVREAMRTGRAKPGVAYSPSKDAIDGIIYDLTITYDEATGKYVGTYHCNPVKNECSPSPAAPATSARRWSPRWSPPATTCGRSCAGRGLQPRTGSRTWRATSPMPHR
jgi:hypothetical protein